MHEEEFHGYQLASRAKRFLAILTEGIIFTFVMLGMYLLFGKTINYYWDRDLELIDIPVSAIIGLIVGAIFYPLFSGNLVQRMFNLKVISAESGKELDTAPVCY